MSKTPIVILASGRGSNFEAIMKSVRSGGLNAEVAALISDQPGARALEIARACGLKTVVVPWPAKETGQTVDDRRARHGELLLAEIQKISPRFLVLAGYMRLLTPELIKVFRSPRGYSRIANVHPSLLPAFPGLDAYDQAFRYGAKVTGVTVHLVENEVDSGPICAQEAFSILDCRSSSEVQARGLAIEHRLYPESLKWILTEKFEISSSQESSQDSLQKFRRLCVCPN